MYSYVFLMLVLSQQCFGIFINITNGENVSRTHFDEPLNPPDGMMNDQADPDTELLNGYFDRLSKYIYGSSKESTPMPLDRMNATISPDVINEGADLLPSNQTESQVDVESYKELNHLSDNNAQDVITVSEYITINQPESQVDVDVGSSKELNYLSDNNAQDVITVSEDITINQPESQVDVDVGSSKELNYLSDNNAQDVITVSEDITVNQPESQVDVDVGSYKELNYLFENEAQDVIEVSEDFTINQPESQVDVDVVDNQVVAQWVAALIFLIIALYAVIFIIAVAILECKGRGRRTTDDEKYGSSVEKQKLLNGAAISEDTQDYQTKEELKKFNKSYANGALPSESSTVRTDLHHLLGSPVAEVEVFPHGSLQRPPKKGCLHY